MTSLQRITDEQLAQELEYWNWELGEHQDTRDRDSRWHTRLHGIQGMIQRFEEERDRRKVQAEKLERLGSLSIESEDPNQLSLKLA